VDELERDRDLIKLVSDYLPASPKDRVLGIVKFYRQVRRLAATTLVDGTGHKPHYRSVLMVSHGIRNYTCLIVHTVYIITHVI